MHITNTQKILKAANTTCIAAINATKPKLGDGKPVVDFYYGSHTPMAYSESESGVTWNIRNSADTNWLHIQAFKALFMVYKRLLHKIADELCETKSYESKKMNINNDIKLDPTRAKALIVVYRPPSRSHLEKINYLTQSEK